MARFGRVASAMITPFTDDGELDLDVAATLAQWLVAHGNDGLVVAGTTGESATLSHDEQIALIGAVADAVDVPVVAGAGSNDTRAAIELTKKATAAGADAILSVAPYYNRPSQAGLIGHFKAIAAETDLPIMLYDIPVRTGRKIATDTLLELAHNVRNIVALKDAAGDPAETAVFLSQAPADFEVYSGDSSLTLPLLAIGAVGVVGVCSHWTGPEHQEMLQAVADGRLEDARQVNKMLQTSYAFESSLEAPNPIPAKAMMRVLGLGVGPCRAPMDDVPAGLEAAATAIASQTAVGAELGIR